MTVIPPTGTATVVKEPNKRMRQILKGLAINPKEFTVDDVVDGMRLVISGDATDMQRAGFLTALQLQGIGMKPEFLAALANEAQQHAFLPQFGDSPQGRAKFGMIVDIVGTGGDGWNTFNISTTSSLVAAAAGLRVAKHGSRASSSNCGSADLLESMGCDLDAIKSNHVADLLSKHGFCFLFSSTFHPAMRRLSKARYELGFPTPFNILGPLINPTNPDRAVIGVHSKSLGPVMAQALSILGRRNYAVVCGDENLDEISIAGVTHVWYIDKSGKIDYYTIQPSDFGVACHPLSAASGSSLAENQATLKRLLTNTMTEKDYAIRDFVLVNTGFLLYVSGKAQTMKEGADIARRTLESGNVKRMLDEFAQSTQRL
ncbi:anthranilate phosphoribosyltransferase [Coemansia sp. RSA 989]|nr:anthranilate phosphoribosyltransferase [Coemansia sp. RSA 1086]KAJ1749347.1 anthranilate phosphoribosyltransferase [Coemansia sp. RSA 1821]KAJ1865613.1 anthranilate phosphoribosyltransferase [Coemansia sp. RSA 989]KAJ1872798.1 anthranilate phosphoribosyltransferase [Coemansia sp. RSA 990]KAJ2672757.1 anthranilate phosphoribosyltransferase [Coemansia sp. RSA 1085]